MAGHIHWHLYAWRTWPSGGTGGNEQATRYSTGRHAAIEMAVQIGQVLTNVDPGSRVEYGDESGTPNAMVRRTDGTLWHYAIGICNKAKNGTGKDYMCPHERYAKRNAERIKQREEAKHGIPQLQR